MSGTLHDGEEVAFLVKADRHLQEGLNFVQLEELIFGKFDGVCAYFVLRYAFQIQYYIDVFDFFIQVAAVK